MTIRDLSPWVTVPAALLLVAGALLTLVGSLGLLRLANFYPRIHARRWATRSAPAACSRRRCWCLRSRRAAGDPRAADQCPARLTAPITAIVLMQAARARSQPH